MRTGELTEVFNTGEYLDPTVQMMMSLMKRIADLVLVKDAKFRVVIKIEETGK